MIVSNEIKKRRQTAKCSEHFTARSGVNPHTIYTGFLLTCNEYYTSFDLNSQDILLFWFFKSKFSSVCGFIPCADFVFLYGEFLKKNETKYMLLQRAQNPAAKENRQHYRPFERGNRLPRPARRDGLYIRRRIGFRPARRVAGHCQTGNGT